MKYRQWFLLALSPLLFAVALVGVRSFGGSPDVAQAAVPQLKLDLVEDTGWCDTINATDTVVTGHPHQAAICLTGANLGPYTMDIIVKFGGAGLNTCLTESCTGACLDANPDAILTDDSGPFGGTLWDCSGGDPALHPRCVDDPVEGAGTPGPLPGEAFITCGTTDTVGAVDGNLVIAVIEWTADYAGTDTLTFGDSYMADDEYNAIVSCPGTNCIGASVTKTGETAPTPTNTPPPTATPTATATRSCGLPEQPACTPTPRAWTKTPTPAPTGTPAPSEPGEPAQPPPPPPPPPPPTGGTMPQVMPPGTGTGSGGVDWTASLMWTLVGAGAFSVLLGGLYLRRARNR